MWQIQCTALVVLLSLVIQGVSSMPLIKNLETYITGIWTVEDPLRMENPYYLTIKPVIGTDYFIATFNKAPPCFASHYTLRLDGLYANITTLNNQFITALRMINYKNMVAGKSVLIACGNVVEFTLTIIHSDVPTFTVVHRSHTDTSRKTIFFTKHKQNINNPTFFQSHFLWITLSTLLRLVIKHRHLLTLQS